MKAARIATWPFRKIAQITVAGWKLGSSLTRRGNVEEQAEVPIKGDGPGVAEHPEAQGLDEHQAFRLNVELSQLKDELALCDAGYAFPLKKFTTQYIPAMRRLIADEPKERVQGDIPEAHFALLQGAATRIKSDYDSYLEKQGRIEPRKPLLVHLDRVVGGEEEYNLPRAENFIAQYSAEPSQEIWGAQRSFIEKKSDEIHSGRKQRYEAFCHAIAPLMVQASEKQKQEIVAQLGGPNGMLFRLSLDDLRDEESLLTVLYQHDVKNKPLGETRFISRFEKTLCDILPEQAVAIKGAFTLHHPLKLPLETNLEDLTKAMPRVAAKREHTFQKPPLPDYRHMAQEEWDETQGNRQQGLEKRLKVLGNLHVEGQGEIGLTTRMSERNSAINTQRDRDNQGKKAEEIIAYKQEDPENKRRRKPQRVRIDGNVTVRVGNTVEDTVSVKAPIIRRDVEDLAKHPAYTEINADKKPSYVRKDKTFLENLVRVKTDIEYEILPQNPSNLSESEEREVVTMVVAEEDGKTREIIWQREKAVVAQLAKKPQKSAMKKSGATREEEDRVIAEGLGVSVTELRGALTPENAAELLGILENAQKDVQANDKGKDKPEKYKKALEELSKQWGKGNGQEENPNDKGNDIAGKSKEQVVPPSKKQDSIAELSALIAGLEENWEEKYYGAEERNESWYRKFMSTSGTLPTIFGIINGEQQQPSNEYTQWRYDSTAGVVTKGLGDEGNKPKSGSVVEKVSAFEAMQRTSSQSTSWGKRVSLTDSSKRESQL